MAEVRELKEAKPSICQGTIDLLEQILEKAKQGEVISVAIATVNSGGYTANCWHNENQYSQLVGSVGILHVRLAHQE